MTKEEYKHRWYLLNRERILESRRKYRQEKGDELREKVKLLCRKNYHKYRHATVEWINNNREKVRAYKKAYIDRNPEIKKGKSAQRRARRLNATPKWLSFTLKRQIRNFYKACPEGYEVDHIIPLQGKNVCGLHVPWNLQYLTVQENRSKGNKVAA